MGKRGPKPAPNHLKVIKGVAENRINRDEPTPSNGQIVPSVELSEGAREIWNRLVPDMIDKKVLTPWDVDLFVIFCEAYATFHECKEVMGREYVARGAAGGVIKSPYWQIMRDAEAMMSRIGSRFGLTPADRAAIKVNQSEASKGGGERLLG